MNDTELRNRISIIERQIEHIKKMITGILDTQNQQTQINSKVSEAISILRDICRLISEE